MIFLYSFFEEEISLFNIKSYKYFKYEKQVKNLFHHNKIMFIF